MVAAFVLGSVLLSVQTASPSPPSVSVAGSPQDDRQDRAAYLEAERRAGRDPEAHVRLALWCEAHGLAAERMRHLAIAVLTDPKNATARGLLGLVSYGGRWKRPEEVTDKIKADAELSARLAEYNGRREGMPETAQAHWELGLWCEENGLVPEALAHYSAVTRLAPNAAKAWEKLGCRLYQGRWVTDAQIAAEQAEAEREKEAEARWRPRLRQWWKDWLTHPGDRPALDAALAPDLTPRAVATIHALFVEGTIEQQLAAIGLFRRIDADAATRELAALAVMAQTVEVRRAASDALVARDPRESIDALIALMHDPLRADVRAIRHGSELRISDEEVVLRKLYVRHKVVVPVFGGSAPSSSAVRQMLDQQQDRQVASDLRAVDSRNASRRWNNSSVAGLLAQITGQSLGNEPEPWRTWWSDQQGYAYRTPIDDTPKRVITRVRHYFEPQFVVLRTHSSCFAAGTPVHTLLGPRPIETLQVGDQALCEDPETGALGYQPIVRVLHNPPSVTLKIRLAGAPEDEGAAIVATPIHRFWQAGKGWVLARDLKPGTPLRLLGGVARVESVEPSDRAVPVFNLELAGGHTFFVGPRGALVHDNARAQPLSHPFDAAAPGPVR